MFAVVLGVTGKSEEKNTVAYVTGSDGGKICSVSTMIYRNSYGKQTEDACWP